MTKHYTKGGLTVVWKAHLCQHSTNCWKGLNKVFNPKLSPWININGAPPGQIIEQVKKCPSGALSFLIKNHNTD